MKGEASICRGLCEQSEQSKREREIDEYNSENIYLTGGKGCIGLKSVSYSAKLVAVTTG